MKIVYQDSEILVLEKPAGLVTTSSETQKVPSLQDILASEFNIKIERSGIVHRLDKDTSGLLVVAKTLVSFEVLQAQFKERIVKKEYLALVHGLIEKAGKVEAGIIRNPGNRENFIAVASQASPGVARPACQRLSAAMAGREAVTEYSPIGKYQISNIKFQTIFKELNEQSSRAGFHPLTKIQTRKLERMEYNKFTLVRCFPLTGRTHQIRVHLKYLGFPIVGDGKYGGRKTVRLDHRWCLRQFLHAAHLEFNHPTTKERMRFDSKLPEDLEKVLENLEKIK